MKIVFIQIPNKVNAHMLCKIIHLGKFNLINVSHLPYSQSKGNIFHRAVVRG